MKSSERFDRLDALRGAAIVWMAVFHFCFDLNYYRLLSPVQNLYADPFWKVGGPASMSTEAFIPKCQLRMDPCADSV